MTASSESNPATEAESVAAEVERNLPRNFAAFLAHGVFGQTGLRLINAPTFLPHFASELAGSASGGTILRAVQSLGQFISPLAAVSVVEHRAYVKRVGIVFGSAMRIQLLCLALVALFVPSPTLALWLVWLFVGLFGLALGLQGVAFQVVMAKVIPIERRGRLLGLRDVTAAVVLIGVSALGGFLIDRFGLFAGNGYTFLLAFALTNIGLGAFASVREPPGRELRTPTPFRERVRELPALLRAEPDFRRYLSARLLASAARGVLPLYIVWIGREFGMTGARLGTFTVMFTLAQSGSTMGWGWLGDRGGYKRVFQLSTLGWLAGTALLLLSPSVWLASLTYALVGAGVGGFILAGSNLVLEFGTERERAMRIATHNSSTELAGMLGFLGAGLLADGVSFRSAFLVSIGLQVLAILRMRGMRDPRARRSRPGRTDGSPAEDLD